MTQLSQEPANGAALAGDLDGHAFEDLSVGMTALYSKTVTESSTSLD